MLDPRVRLEAWRNVITTAHTREKPAMLSVVKRVNILAPFASSYMAEPSEDYDPESYVPSPLELMPPLVFSASTQHISPIAATAPSPGLSPLSSCSPTFSSDPVRDHQTGTPDAHRQQMEPQLVEHIAAVTMDGTEEKQLDSDMDMMVQVLRDEVQESSEGWLDIGC